jgi:uncharacterized membrane protein
LLWQNGLIALLGFAFLVFVAIKNARDFLANGKEDMPYRLSIVAALIGVFVYISLFSDEMPLRHGSDFLPISQSNMMFVMMFLFGLVVTPKKAEVKD